MRPELSLEADQASRNVLPASVPLKPPGTVGAWTSWSSVNWVRWRVRMRTFVPSRSKPSLQAAGRPVPGTASMPRHAPFSYVAGITPSSVLSISSSRGSEKDVTALPERAQYAVTSIASLAGWKPPERPLAGCGSSRTTSQSPARAPLQAPAGPVVVPASAAVRSPRDGPAADLIATNGEAALGAAATG